MDKESQCAAACEACAGQCERSLALDPSYLVGSGRFDATQLAVLTCADVCRVSAKQLRESAEHSREVARWCSSVCTACAAHNKPNIPNWHLIKAKCLECVQHCDELVAL